jgi:hypothetical protein
MTVENVEVSVKLPRVLWEQLLQWAQIEHEDETTLLTRAIEQLLRQEADKLAIAKRLEQECAELANLEFDDVGTEDEWLIIQNEALNNTEVDFE